MFERGMAPFQLVKLAGSPPTAAAICRRQTYQAHGPWASPASTWRAAAPGRFLMMKVACDVGNRVKLPGVPRPWLRLPRQYPKKGTNNSFLSRHVLIEPVSCNIETGHHSDVQESGAVNSQNWPTNNTTSTKSSSTIDIDECDFNRRTADPCAVNRAGSDNSAEVLEEGEAPQRRRGPAPQRDCAGE